MVTDEKLGRDGGGEEKRGINERRAHEPAPTGEKQIRRATIKTVAQPSWANSTCIASSVLSKRAWNDEVPRFVKRSSP